MKTHKAPPDDWNCSVVIADIPESGEPMRETFSLALDAPIEHWGQLYTPTSPIEATIEINWAGDEIIAHVSAEGSFSVPCSRCLEDTGVEICGDLRYLFSLRSARGEEQDDEDGDDDGEIGVIEVDEFEGELSLADQVWEVVILGLPERAICREDCLGICPICGADRNKKKCSCREDQGTDPRFEVLRGLIKG